MLHFRLFSKGETFGKGLAGGLWNVGENVQMGPRGTIGARLHSELNGFADVELGAREVHLIRRLVSSGATQRWGLGRTFANSPHLAESCVNKIRLSV